MPTTAIAPTITSRPSSLLRIPSVSPSGTPTATSPWSVRTASARSRSPSGVRTVIGAAGCAASRSTSASTGSKEPATLVAEHGIASRLPSALMITASKPCAGPSSSTPRPGCGQTRSTGAEVIARTCSSTRS